MRTLELEQGEISRSALDFQARVLEAATISVAVINSEGKIVLANRAAAEVCGAEVEEVIGRSVYKCIAPNDVIRVAELIHIALAYGMPVSNAECEVAPRDGLIRAIKYRGGQSELFGGADFSLRMRHILGPRRLKSASLRRGNITRVYRGLMAFGY